MNKYSVTVIIKALNEEKKIARTIETALQAVSHINAEVILADSCSTDKTVEIAARYPIKIVKLKRIEDRSCGVGAQLGFQIARGEYIWIVDGDMELLDGFIDKAITCLRSDATIAGVAGRVIEKNMESLEFRARVNRAAADLQPGFVDRLDGGGVYRRSAIESVTYLTNQNLHSYEEFELAARLRANGWRLLRLQEDAVLHFGHKTEAFSLLIRRWKSGYTLGIGELLRAALGRPHFSLVLRELREVRLYSAVLFSWMVLAALSMLITAGYDVVLLTLFCLIFPLLTMTVRKRSLITAVYSLVSWNVYTLGMVCGFFRRQRPPCERIESLLIKTGL